MNTNVEKPVLFDESCAQENVLTAQRFAPVKQSLSPNDAVSSGSNLKRLDLYLWMLCFLFGTLFGRQFLPSIETWLGGF